MKKMLFFGFCLNFTNAEVATHSVGVQSEQDAKKFLFSRKGFLKQFTDFKAKKTNVIICRNFKISKERDEFGNEQIVITKSNGVRVYWGVFSDDPVFKIDPYDLYAFLNSEISRSDFFDLLFEDTNLAVRFREIEKKKKDTLKATLPLIMFKGPTSGLIFLTVWGGLFGFSFLVESWLTRFGIISKDFKFDSLAKIPLVFLDNLNPKSFLKLPAMAKDLFDTAPVVSSFREVGVLRNGDFDITKFFTKNGDNIFSETTAFQVSRLVKAYEEDFDNKWSGPWVLLRYFFKKSRTSILEQIDIDTAAVTSKFNLKKAIIEKTKNTVITDDTKNGDAILAANVKALLENSDLERKFAEDFSYFNWEGAKKEFSKQTTFVNVPKEQETLITHLFQDLYNSKDQGSRIQGYLTFDRSRFTMEQEQWDTYKSLMLAKAREGSRLNCFLKTVSEVATAAVSSAFSIAFITTDLLGLAMGTTSEVSEAVSNFNALRLFVPLSTQKYVGALTYNYLTDPGSSYASELKKIVNSLVSDIELLSNSLLVDTKKEDIRLLIYKLRSNLDSFDPILVERIINIIFGNYQAKGNFKKSPNYPVFFAGSPGSGKSTLARSIANSLSADYYELNLEDQSPEKIFGNQYSVSAFISRVLEAKRKGKRLIVFIDEVDRIVDGDPQIWVPFFLKLFDPESQGIYCKALETFIDMSHVDFLLAGNHFFKNVALMQRLIPIQMNGYSLEQKMEIVHKKMLKEVLNEYSAHEIGGQTVRVDLEDFASDEWAKIEEFIRNDPETGLRSLKSFIMKLVSEKFTKKVKDALQKCKKVACENKSQKVRR